MRFEVSNVIPLGRRMGSLVSDSGLGETYHVAPNEKHEFYYVKDMTPEEVLFIKCFDSWSQGQPRGKDGIAALTPHTAFVDPATPEDAQPRQSIEVRCLVFYE
jgi:hypothetical protein